ncbi:MAG: hypothetical protein QF380_06140 [Candidatus Marinimicrobia bacterium]|nr:hypothetical protein [Candidatus Neomarinimicrobiota bacterium]MDP7027967.1 hypothetical protein [Candidatus Neomarinimicrobiota bacterium]
MKNSSLKYFVENSIVELLSEVIVHPLSHFSEKSLQVRLADKLLKNKKLSTPIKSGINDKYFKQINRLNITDNYKGKVFSVPPLQMEYGLNIDSKPYRMDIVILDPAEIKSICSWQLQNENKKYLEPVIGIEIGTEKSSWGKMSGNHLENDAQKMKKGKVKFGYILNIMRNTNVCKKNSLSYKKKYNQINNFKKGMEEFAISMPVINWVGMIHHIAYQEIEVFSLSTGWKKIDLRQSTFGIKDILFH